MPIRPERFTERAQEALAASQDLVRRYTHNQWDIEHVLLALLEQEDSLTVKLLTDLGVDYEAVKQQVEAALQRAPKVTYEAAQIYATPRINRLFTTANSEADRLKDEFIGTEHLLIAIASEQQGEAYRVLRAAGARRARVHHLPRAAAHRGALGRRGFSRGHRGCGPTRARRRRTPAPRARS